MSTSTSGAGPTSELPSSGPAHPAAGQVEKTAAGRAAANPLAVLAYDSAKERLKSQDTTLGNLRTRSTTLLSSAAVLTTVAAAVGLLYTDPAKGPVLEEWASWALMALVAINGLCAMTIVWPTRDWTFVPSPRTLLKFLEDGKDETVARVEMVAEIRTDMTANEAMIDFRVKAFRIQVAALVSEVLVLVYALTRLQ